MKTLLSFVALCVLALSGCKKSSGDVTITNYLTVTIDGTSRSFNTSLVGALSSGGGAYALQIQGFAGAAGSSDALYIAIASTSPITATTYSDGAGASISYVQYGGGSYSNALSATNPITITITSISSTGAAGTFKGDIFLSGNSSSTKKVLTSGTFNVTF
ncbi:MAG TPA: hypothetical protein VKH37_01560 [Ferruginibacter sp.]|nr:hypothetical protein [Ferruginibacter sp.]